MLGRLAGVWSWLVDGTSEAVGWMVDGLRRRPLRTVAIAGEDAEILDRHGSVLARLVGSEGAFRLDPPEAIRRLSGSAIDIAVPPAWVFRRQLEPVAAQGAPFLHAFVQHQIERVTPWRAEDVHLSILSAPLPGDPSRLAVEIATVPRRLTAGLVEALRACGPERIALVAAGADGRRVVLRLEDRGAIRAARRRPTVALALAGFLLVWPVALGWLWWITAEVAGEIAEADAVIEQRKAVLAAASLHDRAADLSEAALRKLRKGRPRAVDIIEALSAALPDTAYATDIGIEKDVVRLSGVSTDTPRLVPALENSGRFAEAVFSDTTTRVEGGRGDRFHIEMRARSGDPAGPRP